MNKSLMMLQYLSIPPGLSLSFALGGISTLIARNLTHGTVYNRTCQHMQSSYGSVSVMTACSHSPLERPIASCSSTTYAPSIDPLRSDGLPITTHVGTRGVMADSLRASLLIS
ncbi:hypothetical protein EDB81DRAFT_409193 [Dactylonectria macrodidyma]|uniref:Uncharacterized protein n=1 Tax=Dactylonectria macrodidyma TaxID=307937 RepID=A0A9P9JEA8_9HYPO|nr:hypothetical protein EDB81DRAFT_409193 [Dactylonectria macrodidyma]